MCKIILFFVFSINVYGQKNDYKLYHENINKAEEMFYLRNQTDSALYYYDKTFKDFDFIFVKDLVNAAQIAIFKNKPYQKYIEQGFEHGLKLEHLKKYPLFKTALLQLTKDEKLISLYKKSRIKYLSKIDFDYLDIIYKMAIDDQQMKTSENYVSYVLTTTDKLRDLIIEKGFPGDRLLGISDSLIFKEINKPNLDLHERIKTDKNLLYMRSEDNLFSQKWPFIMFIHNQCSYKLYYNYFLSEIEKGNIHPREVALIYDNMYRFKNRALAPYCEDFNHTGVYRLNMFTDYSQYTNIDETNKMRKALYIVSTDVDEKKKDFEFDYDFKLFTGFWYCR